MVGHAIQALGEDGKVPGLRGWRPGGEVAGGHRIRHGDHPPQGSQDVAADEVAPEHDENPDVQRDDGE